jgi:hypothetical protein
MQKTVNINPSPRVLRILGDIPFEPWQCVAELIDNSIDAFSKLRRVGKAVPDAKIDVVWSDDSVGAQDRSVEVVDNAGGMKLSRS